MSALIPAAVEDHHRNLWFASDEARGLLRLKPQASDPQLRWTRITHDNTHAGRARYRLDQDRRSLYTRAQGMPTSFASAIAFDSDGNLYLGTQCEGIATARPHRPPPTSNNPVTPTPLRG